MSTRCRRSTSRCPGGRRRKSRSLRIAASRAATLPCPSSRPFSTRCASRGCWPSRAIARPCGVIAADRSSAPRSTSNARAVASDAAGGGVSQGRVASLAPHKRQLERERREVGVQDLGRREGQQAALLLLGPQAIADAGLEAAGAAAALVGGGLADAHGLEPRHARARREARHAHQAGVDHDAHAFDGEAGFGDRGRQHDLAPAGGRGGNGAILVGGREVAVERRHVDVAAEVQAFLDAADLADAGQEHQGAAALFGEARGAPSRRRCPRCGPRARGRDSACRPGTCGRPMAITGAPPRRSDTGPGSRVADMAITRRSSRNAVCASRTRAKDRSVSRPRSCSSSKITQPMPSSDGSSCSIRRKSPSVTTSMRVRGPDLGVEPHAIAHGLADRFAQGRRHAPRGGARRQPPRLLHDDLGVRRATARRARPTARASSCRRRAVPPGRRRCVPPAPLSDAAALRRREESPSRRLIAGVFAGSAPLMIRTAGLWPAHALRSADLQVRSCS